jgi:putative restriction endonuclease
MPSGSLDQDWQLRLAAFDALRRLTEPTGGVITRDQMTTGFLFRGERVAFADRGRGIWRPKILGSHGAALSVITSAPKPGHTAPYDDGAANDEGWLAYRYQRRSEDSWDNAALRRACQGNLPIIYFSGVAPGVFSAVFPAYVVADERADRTFRLASVGVTVDDPAILAGGETPLVKNYMLQVVKRRLHQHKFRELVVTAYGRRCTVCRLGHDELLDAAHILEDRDERGHPEVANGLALCKIHHSAYDANILGIDPDRRIHIRAAILDEVDGPMLEHGIQAMDGVEIDVPRRAALRPRREYLEERFAKFLAA